jgi:hypothetical protein
MQLAVFESITETGTVSALPVLTVGLVVHPVFTEANKQ